MVEASRLLISRQGAEGRIFDRQTLSRAQAFEIVIVENRTQHSSCPCSFPGWHRVQVLKFERRQRSGRRFIRQPSADFIITVGDDLRGHPPAVKKNGSCAQNTQLTLRISAM